MADQKRDILFFAGEFLYSLLLPETRRRALLSAAALPDLPMDVKPDLVLYRNIMYGVLAAVVIFLMTVSLAVLMVAIMAGFFARRVAERLYARLSLQVPQGSKSVNDYLRDTLGLNE